MKFRKSWLSLFLFAAASLTWATPTAQAAGACTDLAATNPTAFMGCILNSGANCATNITGPLSQHVSCTYPDNGRDECDYQGTLWNMAPATINCQYVPPAG